MGCRTFVTFLLAATASLHAVSAASIALRRSSSLLRWQGPIDPSKPDVITTLHVADVSELWNKVLEMNPKWIQEIANPKETLQDYGRRVCGSDSQVATGVSDEITHILTRLRSLKGYWTIEANQCHRLGCGDDSGVYWCNENDWPIRTSAQALFLRGSHVRDLCCHRNDGALYYRDPMSGVEFFPDDHPEATHSNVAVGYGNCSGDINTVPISYAFPGKLGVCLA